MLDRITRFCHILIAGPRSSSTFLKRQNHADSIYLPPLRFPHERR